MQHTESEEKFLLGHATANAAAPSIAAPSLFHRRIPPTVIPDGPVGKLSFLQAYLDLASSAAGLYAEAAHHLQDDELANRLVQGWCANDNIRLSPSDYTAPCVGEKGWHETYAEAKRICPMPIPTPTRGGVFIPGFVDKVEAFCGALAKYGKVEGCVDPASLSMMGAKARRGLGRWVGLLGHG